MENTSEEAAASKRRNVNLTIRGDVLAAAKSLNLNASQAAETGILTAIKQAQEAEWLRTNRAGIEAHNERVHQRGPLLAPAWKRD